MMPKAAADTTQSRPTVVSTYADHGRQAVSAVFSVSLIQELPANRMPGSPPRDGEQPMAAVPTWRAIASDQPGGRCVRSLLRGRGA